MHTLCMVAVLAVYGYLAHKKSPPPCDHHRILGLVLLWGPRGALFLMSEVALYPRGKLVFGSHRLLYHSA